MPARRVPGIGAIAGARCGGTDSMLILWTDDPDRRPPVELDRLLHERLRSIRSD